MNVLLVLCFLYFLDDAEAARGLSYRGARERSIQQQRQRQHQVNETTVAESIADASADDRVVRKRSKWTPSSSYALKEAALFKRIVAEVIADRDAQIASALFEVAKNQPHLQMMVQSMNELSQSSQRLELSINRLDEAQRRLDGRMGVISEKMSLIESRLSQNERRIEREMTQVYGKMEDFLRSANNPDKSSDSTIRLLKQVADQLAAVEELLLDNLPASNKVRGKSRASTKFQLLEMQKLSSTISQSLSAAHSDLLRVLRETEESLHHQLSMLSNDNGVFSCTLSRLLDLAQHGAGSSKEPALGGAFENNNTLGSPTRDGTDGSLSKCLLTCP